MSNISFDISKYCCNFESQRVFIPFLFLIVNFMFNQKISNKILCASLRGGLVSLVAALGLSESVMAQSSFEITNSSTSGGGGSSSGGTFAVVGTIGQAATGPISGGEFQFMSGYLATNSVVYLGSDLNCDGETNAADLGDLLIRWGDCPNQSTSCVGDINEDSVIDAIDLGRMLLDWS